MGMDRLLRRDYQLIEDIVPYNARVLDLGCGEGSLLLNLRRFKRVVGYGIEINEEKVACCVEKGLNVHHGNVEEILKFYSDKSFDYVILSQTLQEVGRPDDVLRQIVRVGKRAIVSFPNFAHWKIRAHLLFKGTAPKSSSLPYEWYESPNIHFLSIKDFYRFCELNGIEILRAEFYSGPIQVKFIPNLFGEQALFLIEERQKL